MKKKLLLIILVITSMIANSQNCFWAKSAGGTNNEEGQNIATDLNGNAYVVGNCSGSITFGSTTLTGSNNFIVKYNAGGTVQWAKALGGEAGGIVTDNAGNIYITGSFGGTKTFGSTVLMSIGESDVFTAKLDTNGNFIWAKSAGGIRGDYSNSISTDGSNVYITGKFYSDSITFGTTKFTNKGTYNTPDLFIAKYDASNGNPIWAKSAGGNRYDIGNGIITDGNNNIYITGSFQSDSIKFGSITLYSTGGEDMFITN